MRTAAALEVLHGLPPDWNDLVGQSPPTARSRWFSLVGTRLPGPPLVFRSGHGELPVALCGTVVERPPANRRIDPHAILSGAASVDGLLEEGPHPWGRLPPAAAFPCALIMLPNYECLPVGPGSRDPGRLRGLVADLCGWCTDQGLRGIAFLYLPVEAEPLRAVLDEAGFEVLPLATTCELPVTWDDFAGYLGGLRKKRRVAVKHEIQELTRQGVVVRERSLEECRPRLVELRCALVAKYGGRPNVERERAMLDRLKSAFPPEDVTVVVAESRGEVVGFTLLVRDGDLWTAFMTGADYTTDQARLTYFATAYYRPAELAPAAGIRRIAYGPGSWRAKRLRGCQEIPLWAAAHRFGG